ncbi:MAG: hypothetical protein R3B84_06755 [Zavarzinella sp.]
MKKINCHCRKWLACKLCHGVGKYDYTAGERGFVPFVCPTCEGNKQLQEGDASLECRTCKGQGFVDPANPPPSGMIDVLVKILFGA